MVTTKDHHITLQQPVVETSSKVKANPQVLKVALEGQGMDLLEKEKVPSHQIREEKML